MPANELLTEIHNAKQRMPLILPPEAVDTWLTGTPGNRRSGAISVRAPTTWLRFPVDMRSRALGEHPPKSRPSRHPGRAAPRHGDGHGRPPSAPEARSLGNSRPAASTWLTPRRADSQGSRFSVRQVAARTAASDSGVAMLSASEARRLERAARPQRNIDCNDHRLDALSNDRGAFDSQALLTRLLTAAAGAVGSLIRSPTTLPPQTNFSMHPGCIAKAGSRCSSPTNTWM